MIVACPCRAPGMLSKRQSKKRSNAAPLFYLLEVIAARQRAQQQVRKTKKREGFGAANAEVRHLGLLPFSMPFPWRPGSIPR